MNKKRRAHSGYVKLVKIDHILGVDRGIDLDWLIREKSRLVIRES